MLRSTYKQACPYSSIVELTFLFSVLSRITLCMFSEKNMYADLNRFGAPGAFLNLVLWVFFAVDMMLMSFKFSGVDFMNGYGDENETVSVPGHLGFLGTSPPEKSF